MSDIENTDHYMKGRTTAKGQRNNTNARLTVALLGWFNGQTISHLVSTFWPKINVEHNENIKFDWLKQIHPDIQSKKNSNTHTLRGQRRHVKWKKEKNARLWC